MDSLEGFHEPTMFATTSLHSSIIVQWSVMWIKPIMGKNGLSSSRMGLEHVLHVRVMAEEYENQCAYV